MPRRKAEPPPCPQADRHTPDQPEGYQEWHAWAEEMGKTHEQQLCPGCGFYKIWIPRASTPDAPTEETETEQQP